jgi:RNA polymerase sigma factor (sigma-70 family)
MALDDQEFTAFLRDRKGLLRSLIRRTGLADWDAEEVLQDVSLRLFEKAVSIPLSSLRWQLAGFVRNCVREFLRHQAAYSLVEEIDNEMPSERPGPGEAFMEGEESKRLLAAVAALPSHLAEAYCLKFVEGRSYDQIARQFRISKSTAFDRVKEARARVHAALDLGLVEGFVIGPDGKGIGSALASIRGECISLSQSMLTDGSGGFRFVFLPMGQYILSARKKAYATRSAPLRVDPGLNMAQLILGKTSVPDQSSPTERVQGGDARVGS